MGSMAKTDVTVLMEWTAKTEQMESLVLQVSKKSFSHTVYWLLFVIFVVFKGLLDPVGWTPRTGKMANQEEEDLQVFIIVQWINLYWFKFDFPFIERSCWRPRKGRTWWCGRETWCGWKTRIGGTSRYVVSLILSWHLLIKFWIHHRHSGARW